MNIRILSKDDSKKLMNDLITKGCLRTIELKRHGVRLCTIAECWDEIAYKKYQHRIQREGVMPAILIRQKKQILIEKAIAAIDTSIYIRNTK